MAALCGPCNVQARAYRSCVPKQSWLRLPTGPADLWPLSGLKLTKWRHTSCNQMTLHAWHAHTYTDTRSAWAAEGGEGACNLTHEYSRVPCKYKSWERASSNDLKKNFHIWKAGARWLRTWRRKAGNYISLRNKFVFTWHRSYTLLRRLRRYI